MDDLSMILSCGSHGKVGYIFGLISGPGKGMLQLQPVTEMDPPHGKNEPMHPLFCSLIFHQPHLGSTGDFLPPSKPNIRFILTDDQGYGDWSIHRHPLRKTPQAFSALTG
jgi:hypothetical protein